MDEFVSFDDRCFELRASMVGFEGLIDVIQGMVIGYSIATGQIFITHTADETRKRAAAILVETDMMCKNWGVEK